MNLRSVREAVELKMRQTAPGLYSEMVASGLIAAYLDEIADDIKDQVVDATIRVGLRPDLQDAHRYLARIQEMEDTGRRIRDALLAELEFPVVS